MTSDIYKKEMNHEILSGLVTATGAALLIFIINEEGESGAVPLFIVTGGIELCLASLYFSRSRQI